MITQLDLYILNNDNSVAPFPSEAEQIVLYDFTFEAQRMGSAPEITATIQANGSLENSLTTKVFYEYNGERYFLKNLPSSAKENTDPRYTFDLTFVSERTILDNVYMVDAVQGDSNIDRYQSNSTIIVFTGTIEEFVGRLNASMAYTGVGYSVVLDEGIATESKLVSFQNKFFTEALQEGVNIFNIPYYYVGKVIHFGLSQNTTPTLKYGDGLLSIDKSINSERIVNRATATGSSTNIPYYYPNPTPRGEIKVTHDPLMDLVVDNYCKASKIPEGTTLVYRDAWGKVDLFAYYPYYMDSIDIFLPPVYYDKKVFNGVIYAGNARSFFFAGIETGANNNTPIDVDVEAVFKATMDNPFESNIKIKGLRLYRDDNGELKEVDSQIDYSYDLDLGEWGKSDTLKLTLKISVKDFPADSVRFLSVELKDEGLNNNNIPVSFSFNNYQYGHDEGWYIKSSNEHYEGPVDLGDYGIRILNDAKDGEIGVEVINKIPFATSLMPPIYRESNGERRFYNAVNGAYEGVIFENEYSKENPKEAITTFEDIKPTIVGVTNAYGERIDMFAEFAYDLNDSNETEQTDESSESFIHPYFYAKLRKTNDAEGGDKGFNLFAQAIESGEMTIEMTSGHCGACKFVIAVDENTQRNLVMVDADGNLVYDEATGKVKMASDATGLDRQNDTQNYEVWIALKKDINTFGTVMPMANSTIKPSIDDTFVITNILLPQAYFTAAEKKLEAEIIAFLEKNNAFQFKYNVNFSRIFLKKRNDVFSLLSENAVIPIEYNGKKSSFYISSYTYRKQKNDVLPEISVSLTDNFDSTPSSFQQTINSVQTNVGKAVSNVGHKINKFVKKEIAETRSLVAETTGEFVSISGEETIKGWKNFVGGLSVNGQNIIYDKEKKVWQLVGDLLVTGAVTMFGNIGGFTPSTIMDAVLYDDITIKRNSAGQLYVASGAGVDEELVNRIIADALKNYVLTDTFNTELAKKWTRNDTQITNWNSAFNWGDHSKAGYAKATDVNTQLKQYILKDTVEQISARHNFTDGLQIAGINIYKSQDKTIYLDANLVVSGAFAMFGKNSTTFETIWKDIPFDDTMEWNGSTWSVVGGANNIDVTTVNGLIYEYLNRTGEEYAKQRWVNQQGFAKQSALTAVDNRLVAVEVFFATEDNDTLVNKWAEIVAFLNATEGDTLDSILSTKANKATTLAGYGITDAYTKAEINNTVSSLNSSIATKWTQDNTKIANWDSAYGWGNHASAGYAAKTYVDTELTKYVLKATAQSIEAQHNFVNGLQIGGLPITKLGGSANTIYLDANLVVSGAVSMFGTGSTTFPTIWANIPFNPAQMSWDGSQWSVVGGGTGSVDDATVRVIVDEVLGKKGYATEKWVTDKDYATVSVVSSVVSSALNPYALKTDIPTTLPASDVYAWAKASSKPSYSWSEILSRPTALSQFTNDVPYATQSWVGNNYLSLSGGTINGNLYFRDQMSGTGLNIMNGVDNGNAYSQIIFDANGGDGIGSDYGYFSSYQTECKIGYKTKKITIDDNGFSFNGSITAPSFIGNLTGNAGSATKLSTPRTIWGQSFDGTGNVTGQFRLLYQDSFDGNVAHSILNYEMSPYGLLTRIYGSGAVSLQAQRETTATEFYPLYLNPLGGNVAIGGTTADAKLHIYGDILSKVSMQCVGDYGGYAMYAGIRDGEALSIERLNSSGSWVGMGVTLLNNGNVGIGGNDTGSCKLRIRTTRADQFSWELGDLVSKSDFAIDFYDSADSSIYGLYASINYISAAVGLQVGRSDGIASAYGLMLNPLGGNVAIGRTSASAKLHVGGDIIADGAITMFSQLSMKDVIDYDGLSLAQLEQIKPARFTWVDDRDTLIHAGGIADDVMQVLPEVVYRTADDKLTMDYGSAGFFIAASLIKPVIDHERRIADLERENKQLKKQLEQLRVA